MENNRKVDNSLLNLEKKLGNGSTEDILLNKFKLKPNINISEVIKKNNFSNLNSFISEFKKSTEELVNNPEMIECKKIEDINKDAKDSKNLKEKKYIKMDLALGVLDLKEKNESKTGNKESLLNNVISHKNAINTEDSHPLLNGDADQEILKFLLSNAKKKKKNRRRIHKIKK